MPLPPPKFEADQIWDGTTPRSRPNTDVFKRADGEIGNRHSSEILALEELLNEVVEEIDLLNNPGAANSVLTVKPDQSGVLWAFVAHTNLTGITADQHHNESHTAASHSDITSTGANIDDAVSKKHTQGTDTTLGAMTAAIDMNTHLINGVVDPVDAQDAATKNYVDTTSGADEKVGVDSGATAGYLGDASNNGVLRTSTGLGYVDGGNFITLSLSHLGIEALTDPGGDRIMFWDETDEEAVTWLTVSTGLQINGVNLTTKDSEIAHDSLSGFGADNHHNESHNAASHSDITSTGAAIDAAVAASHAESHNAASHLDITSTGANIDDAVSKKHTQGTDTTLGAMTAAIDMNTHLINGVVDPVDAQDAATKNYVDTVGGPDEKVGVDSDATPGYLGAASNDGVLRTETPLTYADNGNYVTLDIDQTDYLPLMTNNNAGTVYKCHAVFCDGNDDFDLAQADGPSTPEVIGVIESTSIVATASGIIRTEGILTATTGQWDVAAGTSGGLTAGTEYYLSDANPGMLTSTEPSLPGSTSVRIGIALSTTKLKLLIATAAPGEAAALPIITENITLYITTGGSDVTGDSTEGNPWATLAQALAWLSDKLIAAAATVTIQIDDGLYEWSSTDTINHINGDKINIVGKNTYDLTLSSIQSSSGSSGAWAIIVNVNDVSNASVGDFILFPYNMTGGIRPVTMCGCWIITNVDVGNTRLTVTSTHRHTSAPSGAVSGTVTLVKTVLEYDGCDGITIGTGGKLGLLDKLIIRGTGTDIGINISPGGNCTAGSNLGVSYFNGGVVIAANSNYIGSYSIFSSSVAYNIYVDLGALTFLYGVSTGSGQGLVASAAKVTATGVVLSGNNTYGMNAAGVTNVVITSCNASYNTGTGVRAANNTFIYAATSTILNNGTNLSPAVNPGNVESWITKT